MHSSYRPLETAVFRHSYRTVPPAIVIQRLGIAVRGKHGLSTTTTYYIRNLVSMTENQSDSLYPVQALQSFTPAGVGKHEIVILSAYGQPYGAQHPWGIETANGLDAHVGANRCTETIVSERLYYEGIS
jgi:hypothetical protein